MIDLSKMSVQQLLLLATKAKRLADDLKKKEPSVTLALANGVSDVGYDTVANGYVSSYRGEATITMEDGSVWKAIGHGPRGDAYSIWRQGYIEFVPLSPQFEPSPAG